MLSISLTVVHLGNGRRAGVNLTCQKEHPHVVKMCFYFVSLWKDVPVC